MTLIANWLTSFALALTLAGPLPEPPTYPPPTPPTYPPIVALSVGDSLTYGTDGSVTASYRGELSRLMRKTGQSHTWIVAAIGGTKCSYWAARIDTLITLYQPHMVFLNCGTNDTPSDNTEADYRTILSAATSRGVQVVASLVGIPDMRANAYRPDIDDWMHETNAAIKRALANYPQVPVANFERIPANPEWLQADGIHLTARAEAAYGQRFYQAARALRGWLTFAQMGVAEMCGLSGAWYTDPWPTDYRVCLS